MNFYYGRMSPIGVSLGAQAHPAAAGMVQDVEIMKSPCSTPIIVVVHYVKCTGERVVLM